MHFPPAIIAHSLADINRAAACARPFTVLSAPGAALYAGCLWWRELIIASNFTGPSFLDCADAPGRAVEALRLGLPGLILAETLPAFAAVAEIAAQNGAMLLTTRPPALDLAAPDAGYRLTRWLGG
ncbi:MAG: hypothetical protein POH28_11590 [Acidocella sp.]|nr:hypothetical protein [Acidocella sp.]